MYQIRTLQTPLFFIFTLTKIGHYILKKLSIENNCRNSVSFRRVTFTLNLFMESGKKYTCVLYARGPRDLSWLPS